ncbi:alanine aminotransferase [Aureococcus anophagefferens]|nr:alanine aminotransferase [Aureococcus anophagefferens]
MKRLSLVALAASLASVQSEGLDIDAVNPKIVEAQYAVRGFILDRAREIEADLAQESHDWPFDEIVRCNIGNPQALGQAPPKFAREVLSNVVLPKTPRWGVSKQVRERADAYRAAIQGGVGAYSESQGITLIRKEVAKFISDRDGIAADPEAIFLTDGASAGVRHLTQLLSADWAAPVAEIAKAYDVVARGATPKMLVIINPGNPTGASLPREALEAIVEFVASKPGLVLMADEVYQENVYGDAPAFISFKKVVHDLKSTIPVVSFHSVSKGFTGECGLRGGYFELTNVSEEVKEQLIKLASVSLCSNVLGQIAVGLMVNPPVDGRELKAYEDEKAAAVGSQAA